MRAATSLAALLLIRGAGTAVAKDQIVPVVHSASAAYETSGRHTLVVRATVDLPNSCWTHPRLVAPPAGARPDADGMISVSAVAESAQGPGVMCSMIFRPGVEAAALRWTPRRTAGLKAVKVIGSTTPVIAPIAESAAPGR